MYRTQLPGYHLQNALASPLPSSSRTKTWASNLQTITSSYCYKLFLDPSNLSLNSIFNKIISLTHAGVHSDVFHDNKVHYEVSCCCETSITLLFARLLHESVPYNCVWLRVTTLHMPFHKGAMLSCSWDEAGTEEKKNPPAWQQTIYILILQEHQQESSVEIINHVYCFMCLASNPPSFNIWWMCLVPDWPRWRKRLQVAVKV